MVDPAWAAIGIVLAAGSQPFRHTNGDRVFDAVRRVIAHRAHDSHLAAEFDAAFVVESNSNFGADFGDAESVRLA
jgi:hypothetical protein